MAYIIEPWGVRYFVPHYQEQETALRHRRYEAAADIYWHTYRETGSYRDAADSILDHLEPEERSDDEFKYILWKRKR